MKRYWILAAAIAIGHTSLAQSDLELAEFYYNEGSYAQAKLYLDQIWKRTKTKKVFDMYYDVLLAMDDFDSAEKLVKSRMRNKNTRATAYVELGHLYVHFEKEEEAKEAFDEALRRLEPKRGNVIALANAFIKLNELERALEAYTKGIDMGVADLDYQLADLEGRRGNYEGMIDASLRLIHAKPQYFKNVQNSFNRNLRIQDNPDLGDLLRTKLIRAAREFPEDTALAEMLVWYFNQVKDFANAFVHAKSLDLRFRESGERLIELAQTATRNEDFATAADCYAYIASKGPENPYFFTARSQALNMRLQPLLKTTPVDRDAIESLGQDYEFALNDLGLVKETAKIAQDLAHIRAFYLQQPDEAIALLEEILDVQGLYKRTAALCKLELGDILVFQDDIWNASLLFSQVELDYKDDILGAEAKFRNARISYYTGDFDWAQTQLDALKASTSKLISNDAIDLSLIITDNYALDTIMEPMWLFAQADLLATQYRYNEARVKLDSIVTTWPGHALTDEVLMELSAMCIEQGELDSAKHWLQEIIDLHFDDILADDAIFQLALILDKAEGDSEGAAALYEQLLFDYPGSLHAVEARRRYRAIRGDELTE